MFLNRRFNLVDPKETEVLRDLEIALRLTDDNPPITGGSDTMSMASATSTLTNTTTSSAMTSSSGIGSMADSSILSDTQQSQQQIDDPICKQPLLENCNDPISLCASSNNCCSNSHHEHMTYSSGDTNTSVGGGGNDNNTANDSDKGGGTLNSSLQPAA